MRGAANGSGPSITIKVSRTRVTVKSLVRNSNKKSTNDNVASVLYHETIPDPNIATTIISNINSIGIDNNAMDIENIVLEHTSTMSPSTSMSASDDPTIDDGGQTVPIKAETPEHLAGTSIGPPISSTVSGHVGPGGALFAGIANSNKRPRPDDWLAPTSANSPQHLPVQHLVYTTPQQQLEQVPTQQQQQPPQQQQEPPQQQLQQQATPSTQKQQMLQQQTLTSSPAISQHTLQVQHQQQQQQPNNNGYVSPMSSGSYDPYSPNGRIAMFCESAQFVPGLGRLQRYLFEVMLPRLPENG
ncbi:hypothetical protein PV326_008705 [Microctonus aethiopoides]|nr:hypothetical protein PV326_008705 [Microctonus aethiopoides]